MRCSLKEMRCSLKVAILTAVLLQLKTFLLYSRHYDQEVLRGEVQMFSRLWQQGRNFTNLPLLGSCTYSISYCPEAPNARVIRPLVSVALCSN